MYISEQVNSVSKKFYSFLKLFQDIKLYLIRLVLVALAHERYYFVVETNRNNLENNVECHKL